VLSGGDVFAINSSTFPSVGGVSPFGWAVVAFDSDSGPGVTRFTGFPLSNSLYTLRKAEHATTAIPLLSWANSVPRCLINLSQGARSASVSGSPRDILATLDAGCRSSPSTKVPFRARATFCPVVDLPGNIIRKILRICHLRPQENDSSKLTITTISLGPPLPSPVDTAALSLMIWDLFPAIKFVE
ncbi:unnamed protein product, partial [Rhizoctonia solani]